MRALILAILLAVSANLPAEAANILIVESRHGKAFDRAAQMIASSCGKKSEIMVMSDYVQFDLARIVREEQPRIVVAIGEQALGEARKLRGTDIVYLLTLNVDERALGSNIRGISMHVAPGRYLQLFKQLQLRRVGIVYNPRYSAAWLERARRAADGSGIELVSQQVDSPSEVPTALQHLGSSGIDSLWMIPDSTAVAPENVNDYFLFAQKQSLPVFSFAKEFLAKGAAAILEISPESIAEQGCAMIDNLRRGEANEQTATVDIGKATLATSQSVARLVNTAESGSGRGGISH